MTTQHTPGPWRAVPPTRAGNGLAWRDIVSDGTAFAPSYVAEALDCDATLIAAAPDLLAALQAVWKFFEPVYVSAMADDTERTAQDELIDTVRAAIAKATGETA